MSGGDAVRVGGWMMVAPKSGIGLRFAFAASIGEPHLGQKAFSSFTASPHLGQLIINFISPPSCHLNALTLTANAPEDFVLARCLRIRGRLNLRSSIKWHALYFFFAGARQYKQICPALPV